MIRSLAFDGYRGFPCRRQYDRTQSFQTLDLAPLTLLIGRNNAGKTSVATLLYQVLGGLAGDSRDALPLTVAGHPVAQCFQDMLYGRDLAAFLELAVSTAGASGRHRLETILYLPGLLDDDPRPRARRLTWDGVDYPVSERPLENTLIPDAPGRMEVQEEARRVLSASAWLGPLREEVPGFPSRTGRASQALPIGPQGQGVTDLLAQDDTLFAEVSNWLSRYAGLALRWEKNLDLWRLQTIRGGARTVPIAQVGTGIHQLLPVLALATWRSLKRSPVPFIDFVQQPELHLHDALTPTLGDLFLDVARAGVGTTIVETHAEGLLLRIRRRIAEGVPPELVTLYYVDDAPGDATLRRIEISDTGEVDYWPPGVFMESYEEVKALRRAQRRKAP